MNNHNEKFRKKRWKTSAEADAFHGFSSDIDLITYILPGFPNFAVFMKNSGYISYCLSNHRLIDCD